MQSTRTHVVWACICTTIWALCPATARPHDPPIAPTPTVCAQHDSKPVNVYTRSQDSRIARARRKVDRLNHDLIIARQRLLALQIAAVPPAGRSEGQPTAGATVCSISSGAVLTCPGYTVGFETNDTVAFVRRDANHGFMITGVGVVCQMWPDSLEVYITVQVYGAVVMPEDEVYVLSRNDSPSSLAKQMKYWPLQ